MNLLYSCVFCRKVADYLCFRHYLAPIVTGGVVILSSTPLDPFLLLRVYFEPKVKITDIVALGFMLFAFFLGAGNIIFPPLAGQLAGDELIPTMLGF